MDYLKRRFNVDNDWLPEAVDKRAMRLANSLFVKDAVEESMNGNSPLMLDFVNNNGVTVAQLTVSGASMSAEPLMEKDNWTLFCCDGLKTANIPFGKILGRYDYDFRAGNDEKTVGTPYGEYHMDTRLLHRAPLNGIPRNKAELPIIAKKLCEKLLEEYSKENPPNP